MPDLRVLIVDDEPAILTALTTRLSACGYQTALAHGGRDGLIAAQRCRPHVILLDIQMPDLDGIEVCRRLKADPLMCHIPVIFLSATVSSATRRQGLAAGGSLFLTKPYDAAEVLGAIEKVSMPLETSQQ